MYQLNSHQLRLLIFVTLILLVGIGLKLADRHRRAIDVDLKGILDGYKYTTVIDIQTNEARALPIPPQMRLDDKPILDEVISSPISKPSSRQINLKSTPVKKGIETETPSIIDINRADSVALLKLPGIGPVLAGRIVAYRDSAGVISGTHDLLKIKGIGAKKLAKIRPYIIF